MAEYININRMRQEVRVLLLEVIGKYEDMEVYELPSEEWVDCCVEAVTQCINKEMGEYLKGDNHEILGCACNVETSYCYHTEGLYWPDKQLIRNLVYRLENDGTSERTQSDRDFLVDWYWKAFGTFEIKARFEEELLCNSQTKQHK